MAGKRFILGLGAAALVLMASCGIGRAQAPVQVGPGGPCCAADGCCGTEGGCATEGCCATCVPAPVTKKVVLRHYSDKCENFCLCRPTCLGGLLNCQEAREKDRDQYVGRGPGDKPCCEGECGCCGGLGCGQPHVKKFLLIHNREHEECEMKCEIPGQGAATGIIVASPGQYPRATTPALNPNRGVIVAPAVPK